MITKIMRHTIPGKKLISLLSLLIFYSICLSHQVLGQTDMTRNDAGKMLKLMTYNIKFASPDFKPFWQERREMLVDMILKYKPVFVEFEIQKN